MTIQKINIPNFGSFNNFVWDDAIRDHGRNKLSFKRLNIIYGRNYSGKTTLSRIFRSLETGRISNNYTAPSFAIIGDKGETNSSRLSTGDYDIRVYNRDFVVENLSFLVNQDGGEIKTFAIVGEKNKTIEDAILAIDNQLGSLESQSGLRHDLEAKKQEKNNAYALYKSAADSLENKLRTHANTNIKQNRDYGIATYNIDSIKKDIPITQTPEFNALSDDEIRSKIVFTKQEVLPKISLIPDIDFKFPIIFNTSKDLLRRAIKPTQAIQELLNDSLLQSWVKEGMTHHKHKREECAFCRQPLPVDIWEVLDSHFNKESTALEQEIDSAIAFINSEISRFLNFPPLHRDIFYSDEKVIFDNIKTQIDECLLIYKQDLETVKYSLKTRKSNIFQTVETVPVVNHNEKLLHDLFLKINQLIQKNNERSRTLDSEKIEARTALRLTDVASFLIKIGYITEKNNIETLKKAYELANTKFSEIEKDISRLEQEIGALRSRQKDEKKGADRVNSLLNHFFGHDGIKLEAVNVYNKTAVKFQVMRDGKSAYNLSEGECSLIAFCYFIAKLEEPESKGKNLIIYIDDPISSLDGNHIFFVFSLIESLIAKPIKNADGSNNYRYKQLFISTHNLDFLKYLKKISIPNEKNGGYQSFVIERNGGASKLALMPAYLRDYITEFNYLFHQIYKYRNPDLINTNHEPFYSFGNNLRKFLEAFLFYKYPCHDDKNDSFERIKKFFGDDETAIALANRLNNELSHLESIFDRSLKPLDIPEIPKLANYVLDKIYTADPDQYNSLLKSIGEPERTGV